MSNDVCPVSRSGSLNSRFRRLLHNPKKMLAEYIEEGNTVADLGCGPGYFSLPMAEMVGESGRVIAVDLQQGMLDIVKNNAQQKSLQSRITFHQCRQNSLDLTEKVDFALAFWMVHEVPDSSRFFREVASILKPGAYFLIVEPRIHIGKAKYREEIEQAYAVGLQPVKEPKIKISRATLFKLA